MQTCKYKYINLKDTLNSEKRMGMEKKFIFHFRKNELLLEKYFQKHFKQFWQVLIDVFVPFSAIINLPTTKSYDH
jgi:hypothetical protein